MCCEIECGITLKVSKSKYKICYNFMGSTLIFQFLYINILNYRYFHTDCLTFFLENKKKRKNKKTFITTMKYLIHDRRNNYRTSRTTVMITLCIC